MNLFDKVAKSIIAATLALATGIATGYDDSVLTSSEKALAVGAAIVALGAVWAFSNEWAKAGIAAAVAGVTALAAALQDDAISAQEWTTIVVAVLGTLYSVYKVQNSN